MSPASYRAAPPRVGDTYLTPWFRRGAKQVSLTRRRSPSGGWAGRCRAGRGASVGWLRAVLGGQVGLHGGVDGGERGALGGEVAAALGLPVFVERRGEVGGR